MPEQDAAIIIRRAAATDAGGILNCLALAFEPYRARYTRDAYLDTVLTADTITARLESMKIFVAVHEDRVVGTIACALQEGNEGHLRGMAVLPEYLGRSLAEQLLAAAEAELRQQRCSRITLDTTEPLERAIRFYEKHGYRWSGKATDFFGMTLHEYVKET